MAAPKNKAKSNERNGERTNGKAWKKEGRGAVVGHPGHNLSGKSKPRGGAAGYSEKRLIEILTERGHDMVNAGEVAAHVMLEELRRELRIKLAEKKERRKEAQRAIRVERARIIADAKRRNANRREA